MTRSNSSDPDPNDDDREVSRELAGALDGRRGDALMFWRQVAEGAPLTGETADFLRHVARAIVTADLTPGRARYEALTAACGLRGDRQAHPELRRFLEQRQAVADMAGEPLDRAAVVREALRLGLVPGEVDDPAGRRRAGAIVDRILTPPVSRWMRTKRDTFF